MPAEDENAKNRERANSTESTKSEGKEFTVIKKNQRHKVFIIPHNNNSGDGEPGPKGLVEKFNWGAFLFNFVWGIKYKKWVLLSVPFLCFVPYVGILAALIMAYFGGKFGNQWAWQEVSYKDEADFHESQKSWVRAWFVLLGVVSLLTGFIFLFSRKPEKVIEEVKLDKIVPISIPEKVYEDTLFEDKHSDFLGVNYYIIYWNAVHSEQVDSDYKFIADEFTKNTKKLEYFSLQPDIVKPLDTQNVSDELVDENNESKPLCLQEDKMCIAKWLNKTCKSHYCILNMSLKQYYRVDKKEDIIPTAIKLKTIWQ